MPRENHNRARAILRGRLFCNKCRKWHSKNDFAEDFKQQHGRKGTCKRCMRMAGDLRQNKSADLDDAILLPMQRRWNAEDRDR